jgi:DNA invertase Pin-like site-specific DNA recombinase
MDSPVNPDPSLIPAPITSEHRSRLAIVYIRQSTPDQVLANTGSAAAQRDLVEVAQRLGWPASRIRVIDTDLGRSGTSKTGRTGYLELLMLMERDEVGIVLVQDLSRLSRKTSDIHSFLEQLEEMGVLIYTNGSLHNPASGDLAATLGLDIAGTFANFDNRVRVRRMRDAKLAKARRGRAVSPAPIGFLRTPSGDWDMEPNGQVRDAIELVFELYPKLGSLGRVVAYFREHSVEFPRRSRGQLRWGPVDVALLHSVLRNPAYCGDYVFQRRQTKKRPDAAGVIVKFRPPDQWIVKRDHHPAYVPREKWQRIQEMLASRRPTLRPLTGKGSALLQGLLRCGVENCGRWMKTQYWGRDGVARSATYVCIRQDGWGEPTHKVTFPASFIEHAVVERVLQALNSVDDVTARAVIEQAQLERTTLERAQHRQLLDAQEDVQRIRQLLVNLPAQLQHARIDLMSQYDAAARRQLELKTKLANETAPSLAVSTADVQELIQRTKNVRQLWQAPHRTHHERKQLLRTVISEIIIQRADRNGADLEIVWKGGLRQELRAYRARGLEAVIADRTQQGKSVRTIVDELNDEGAVTSSGRPISPELVAQKQGQRGLRLKDERRRAREIISQGLLENRPRPEILRQLQDQAPRLGPWDPQQLSEAIRQLRRGAPDVAPLPRVLPAELEKQRVLELVSESIAAGKNWKAMAVALNEAGLKPPRGQSFTPVQLRLLYMHAHRLRSYKLPASGSVN